MPTKTDTADWSCVDDKTCFDDVMIDWNAANDLVVESEDVAVEFSVEAGGLSVLLSTASIVVVVVVVSSLLLEL